MLTLHFLQLNSLEASSQAHPEVLVTPNPVKLKNVLASASSSGGHTTGMRIYKHSQTLKCPKSEVFLIPEIFENGSSPLFTG